MKTFLVALTLLLIGATAATWHMSKPIFNEKLTPEIFNIVEIAPLTTALTFARTNEGDVVLALTATSTHLSGVNLPSTTNIDFEDAISAYHTIGTEALIALASDGMQQTYAWSDLAIPIEEHYPHIAAGTNYRAHAEEVGHDGEPFLFPKLSPITAWNAAVNDGARLDYELEICVVPLTEHTANQPAKLGYLLCGDFTDRWSLVANIEIDGPMGQTGFADGKGGETRFPIGALLAIPHTDDFYKSLDIALYVNDDLRQQANAGLMIWPPYEILSRALADCKTPYHVKDEVVSVADCTAIPARTLILTGTPEGVLFKLTTVWNPLAYLRPGDVVISTAKYLGYMQNEVVSP